MGVSHARVGVSAQRMDLVRLLAVVFAWSLTAEGESIAYCVQGEEGLEL